MISQDSFVGLLHDLGDTDAPPVDGRLAAIHHRITVVRIRRAVTAAVAVIVIVIAGLAVASARSTPPVVVPTQMPKSWTTDDGVAYRLVTVVTLDTAHQASATVDVPAGAPITVRYACAAPAGTDHSLLRGTSAEITIGAGRDDPNLDCSTAPKLADFDTGKLARSGDRARLVIKALATTVSTPG